MKSKKERSGGGKKDHLTEGDFHGKKRKWKSVDGGRKKIGGE